MREIANSALHSLRDRIAAAHVFVADDVERMALSQGDKEISFLEGIPPFTPGFKTLFIEAKRQDREFLESIGINDYDDYAKFSGTLVSALDADNLREAPDGCLPTLILARRTLGGASPEGKAIARWILTFDGVATTHNGVTYLGSAGVVLSEDGQIVSPPAFLTFLSDDAEPAYQEFASDYLGAQIALSLLTLGMANCKGITTREVKPPLALSRARQRRGHAPLVSYKVLAIGPGAPASEAGEGAGSFASRALHLVRGHYSTYTQEKPLFGKFTGRFWINCHRRGDASFGVRLKDYRVVPANP